MIIDSMAEFLVTIIGIFALLFPTAPDLSVYESYLDGIFALVNPFFFPLSTALICIGILISWYALLNGAKVVRFIMNLLRGSGA